ncbi:hypothetical protein D3C86_1895780 [compost metagenome]
MPSFTRSASDSMLESFETTRISGATDSMETAWKSVVVLYLVSGYRISRMTLGP